MAPIEFVLTLYFWKNDFEDEFYYANWASGCLLTFAALMDSIFIVVRMRNLLQIEYKQSFDQVSNMINRNKELHPTTLPEIRMDKLPALEAKILELGTVACRRIMIAEPRE